MEDLRFIILLYSIILSAFALRLFIPFAGDAFKYVFYELYPRLFPKRSAELIINRVKAGYGFGELVLMLKLWFHSPLLCGLASLTDNVEQHSPDVFVGEKKIPGKGFMGRVANTFDSFLYGDFAVGLWVRAYYAAFGHYSRYLRMRLDPFREELIKEVLLSSPSLSEEEHEFVKNYHHQHKAAGN